MDRRCAGVGEQRGALILIATEQVPKAAGRDPSKIGFEGAISYGDGNPDTWRGQLAAWKQMNATHVTLQVRGEGFTTAQQHIDGQGKMIEALKRAA